MATYRLQKFLLIAGLSLVFVDQQSAWVVADHGREIRPESWMQDATINDVLFVDGQHGWAVGDQGVILRTTNGGADWIPCQGVGLNLDNDRSFEQKLIQMRSISRVHELYPLTCSFHSVHFINRDRGWVAGNFYTPYLKRSRSVLLTTTDGGQTWKQLVGNALPKINKIRFQDVLGGWALGRSGSLFQSGVFATSSGGRHWTVQPVNSARHWIDGELMPYGFVVIDDRGVLGRIQGTKYEPAVVLGTRPGRMKSIEMLNVDIGWAVGTAGTVLMSQDGGLSWQRPAIAQGHPLIEQFDFATVAIVGQRVWMAGNPGTVAISLNAATGDDLQVHPMPTPLPIRQLCFANETTGWAVGAQGLILKTSDAGRNWDIQRLNNDRLAILALTMDLSDLPLALLSTHADDGNKLCGCAIIGQHEPLSVEIAQSALQSIGCGTNLELDGGDPESDDRQTDSRRRLEEVVRTIRTFRPNVIVCNIPPSIDRSAASEFYLQCRTAIEMAASQQAFPQQIEPGFLNPWQVERCLVRTTPDSSTDVELPGKRFQPRSSKLLEDQIAIPRALIGLSSVYAVPERYRIESFTGNVQPLNGDVFYGLRELGRDIPTRGSRQRVGNLTALNTTPLKQQEMRDLLDADVSHPEAIHKLKNRIRNFAMHQEAREAGIWMMQLAERWLEQGNLEMAAHTLEQLADRFGDHPFAPAALMWLIGYYSSDEVYATLVTDYKRQQADNTNRQIEVAIAVIDRQLEQELTDDVIEELMTDSEWLIAGQETENLADLRRDDRVQLVGWETELSDDLAPELDGLIAADQMPDAETLAAVAHYRQAKADNFLERLKQTDLDFAHSDQVQFTEALLAKDKTGGFVTYQNRLKRIQRMPGVRPEIAVAVNRELQIEQMRVREKLPGCFYAEQPPRLDGRIDDDLWQSALRQGLAHWKTMRPSGERQPSRTDVCWLAYDAHFLYLAVRCNFLPGHQYEKPQPPWQRDADLSRQDRVRWTLDLDRDWQSEFLFEIDCRGWAAESCAGAAGWNPKWYLAVDHDDSAWMLECAIPWESLTTKTIDENSLIRCSVQRLDPVSIDVWSTDPQRQPVRTQLGIIAGLRMAPDRFDLLRFAPKPIGK